MDLAEFQCIVVEWLSDLGYPRLTSNQYGCVRPTEVSFSQFHEWKGKTKKTEELNGRGPKNETLNQRGIKITP